MSQSVTSSSSSSLSCPPQNQFVSKWISIWETMLAGEPRLLTILSSFRDLERENPAFFDQWGPLLAPYFQVQGPSKKEAIEALRLTWDLCNRFKDEPECQKRLASVLHELLYEPSRLVNAFGTLLAALKEDPEMAVHHLKDLSLANLPCFKAVKNGYFLIFQVKLVEYVNRIPGCDDSLRQLATGTNFGRMLARALLDDGGRVNKGAAQMWEMALPVLFNHFPDIYKRQIELMLHLILEDEVFVDLLTNIGPPCREMQTDIHIQLQRLETVQLTAVHSREAALSALFSYPRQQRAHCFCNALIIGLLQHEPKIILRQLKSLIEIGQVFGRGVLQNQLMGVYVGKAIYCSYASIAVPRNQMEHSTIFRFSIHHVGLSPQGFNGPGEITTRDALNELIQRQNWPHEKESHAIRDAGNMAASFFQNHLLNALANQGVFYADNHIGGTGREVLLKRFANFDFIGSLDPNLKQRLQPLSPQFYILLNKSLFLDRTDQLEDLLILKSIADLPEETLLELAYFFYTENGCGIKLQTWDALQLFLVELLGRVLESFKRAPHSIDCGPIHSAYEVLKQNPHILIPGIKQLAFDAAQMRGLNFPRSLMNSSFCRFLLKGGDSRLLLNDFFMKSYKHYDFNFIHPHDALIAIVQYLKSEISWNPDPNLPPAVLCRFTYQSGSHIHNLFPYNASFKQLWLSSDPQKFIRERIEGPGSTLSKTPLRFEQKIFLTNCLKGKMPEVFIHRVALEMENTPEAIIAHWNADPLSQPYLSILQIALHQAVELIPRGSWIEAIGKLVGSQSATLFPSGVPMPITRANELAAYLSKRTSNSAETPLHDGVRIVFDFWREMRCPMEFTTLLQLFCAELRFPHKILLGDLNYFRESNKLWVEYHYGRGIGYSQGDDYGTYDLRKIIFSLRLASIWFLTGRT